MPSFSVREAQPADYERLLACIPDILRETEGQKTSAFSRAMWEWQYLGTERPPLIVIAEDEGKICGYYHAIFFTMRYHGRRTIGSMEQDVATLPAYRGQGIFRTVAAFLFDRKQQMGVDFVFAFPNAKSIGNMIRHHAYVLVARVPVYFCPLDLGRVLSSRLGGLGRLVGGLAGPLYRALRMRPLPLLPGETVERLERCDASVEELARGFAEVVPIGLERSARYLDWRFLDKPTREYALWGLRRGGRLEAYVVTRRAALFGADCALLMDFGCRPGGEDALRRLIAGRLREERVAGATAAVTMGLHPFFARLGQLGFVRVPERFNPRSFTFTVRALAPSIGPDLHDPANWHLTLADWDVM